MPVILALMTSMLLIQYPSLALTPALSARRPVISIFNTSMRRFYRSSGSRIKSHTPQDINDLNSIQSSQPTEDVPLLLAQGLFVVDKPLEWTSNDVVSNIRNILERDARSRGAQPVKVTSRKNKSRIVRVGHGGTLDPLATGVLVIGVGQGTKEMQSYLKGEKAYCAGGELGFETSTLDLDPQGTITKTAPYDHVTQEAMEMALSEFMGTIKQIPPIFSAIRKNGKRLYEEARSGNLSADDEIEPREVTVQKLTLLDFDKPKFSLEIVCGGGTYVRSLVRDIGYKVDSVATTTYLQRTHQGSFTLEDALTKDCWNADSIYEAIQKWNMKREQETEAL